MNIVVVVGLSRASRVFLRVLRGFFSGCFEGFSPGSPGSPVFLPTQNQPKLNPSTLKGFTQ